MQKVKIFALIGSPRKGNTWRLTELFIRELSELIDVEYDIKRVDDFRIEFCNGCQRCILEELECVIKDDLPKLRELIEKADLFILASPVYVHDVTAQLKKVIDRTCAWLHRPPFIGKYAMVIATTAGSGLLEVLKILRTIVTYWGMICIAELGAIMYDGKFLDEEKALENIRKVAEHVAKVLKGEVKPRTTPEDLVNFKHMKYKIIESAHVLRLDYEYWQKTGLLEREFYVTDKVDIPEEVKRQAEAIEKEYEKYWNTLRQVYTNGGVYTFTG